MNTKKTSLLLLISLLSFGMTYAQSQSKLMAETTSVIDLSNTVINIANAYSKTYGHYDSMITRAQDEMRNKLNNPDYVVTANLGTDTAAIGNDLFRLYETKLSAAPKSFEGKEDVMAAVENARSGIGLLYESGRALNRYFTDRQYDADSETLTAFNHLCNDLLGSTYQASKLWRAASRTATITGSQAESAVLAKATIGEFLVSAKNSMLLLRLLAEDSFDEEKYIDWDDIRERSQALQSVLVHARDQSGMDLKKLKKGKDVEFANFFNAGLELSKDIETLAGLFINKESREKKDQTFDTVRVIYSKTANYFNEFMSMKTK